MPIAKVLLVDDDELVRFHLATILEKQGFEITSAKGVADALKAITLEQYDVLLSDLHMPGAGDGLTVVSAMRHANPRAVTILLSGFPNLNAATDAILLQADEVLVKPVQVGPLVDLIKQRLAGAPPPPRKVESVAEILQRSSEHTIRDWLGMVEGEATLSALRLNYQDRTGHLMQLITDLVTRLRSMAPLGTKSLKSASAASHGALRHKQGYTSAMIVEESRFLQVSIFRTLQVNLLCLDFSVLLVDVMTIADEVDSQLSQTVAAFELASHSSM